MNTEAKIAVRNVLEDVAEENQRQDAKWGEQNHTDGTGGRAAHAAADWARDVTETNAAAKQVTWQNILQEEVYEAFAEDDPAKLRTELIQVAAVAVQWIAALDRRAANPPTPKPHKPRILVDFDGVIHRYSRGWADGTAYDQPMPGARDGIHGLLAAGYDVVVFSSRDWQQIVDWLQSHDFPDLAVTNTKLPAVAQIDDRGIRFTDWNAAIADVLRLYPVHA